MTLKSPQESQGQENSMLRRNPDAPHWAALPIILVGSFVNILDIFIVNVAIPDIQRGLKANSAAVEFIVAGYALAYAAGLITGGRLGDLYGRRRVFGIGLALFTLTSAWCGLAPDAPALVAGRVMEGLSSALMGPQVLAIISVAYTGHARVRAFNAFGLAVGMASVLGQLIGGALIHANVAGLGWRACFLVNVPVGILTLVLIPRLVPESRAPGRPRLDLVGMLLVSAGLVAVVLPLAEGQQQGWPLWTWLCLACSPVLLVAFVVQERRLAAAERSPLVNPVLFRHRSFTVGIVTAIVYYSGIVSFFLVLALYLQHGMGLSALDSGMIFLPLGVSFLATSLNGRYLGGRLGRQCLAVGAVLVAAGLVAMWFVVSSIGTHGNVAWLVPGMMIDGAGMGMVMAPLASVALAGLDPRYAGAASGVLSTANQMGGAVGVAVIGLIFYRALGNPGQASPYAHAFSTSLVFLVPLALAVLVLVQFLPRAKKASVVEPQPSGT